MLYIFYTEMPGFLMSNLDVLEHSLYDHRPLCLNQDDYERACAIPKKKVCFSLRTM